MPISREDSEWTHTGLLAPGVGMLSCRTPGREAAPTGLWPTCLQGQAVWKAAAAEGGQKRCLHQVTNVVLATCNGQISLEAAFPSWSHMGKAISPPQMTQPHRWVQSFELYLPRYKMFAPLPTPHFLQTEGFLASSIADIGGSITLCWGATHASWGVEQYLSSLSTRCLSSIPRQTVPSHCQMSRVGRGGRIAPIREHYSVSKIQR